jgi:hypothetical protein
MDAYRPVFDAMLKATQDLQAANGFLVTAHEALVQAGEAQQHAGQHLTDALTAVMSARDEHEDLRETVGRLEHLVMDLAVEVRALRGPNGSASGPASQ